MEVADSRSVQNGDKNTIYFLEFFESYFICTFTYKNHIFFKKTRLNKQLALVFLIACFLKPMP